MNQFHDKELDIEVLFRCGNNQKQTKSIIRYNVGTVIQGTHHECMLRYCIVTVPPRLQCEVFPLEQ
jgi:hypothetical protein